MSLYIVLPVAFTFFVIVVGGYVYMFLHVMRSDPRELEFRKDKNQDNRLVPHKYRKPSK